MKRLILEVKKRDFVGRKAKKLRREGVLPANIYGKAVKSLAVQVSLKEFEKVFKEVGETGLIDLTVGSEIRPVLIHNVQKDPRTSLPIHADFYQVNLKEKIKTMVPVVAFGTPAAVTDKLGILLQQLSQIEVEALPEDLPEKIEVNVEHLASVDEQIIVADIKTPPGITVLTDGSQVVIKIGELVSKEAQEQAAAEAAAAEAAKAESDSAKAGGAEAPIEGEIKPETKGEKPTEETPKEETKPEEKPQG